MMHKNNFLDEPRHAFLFAEVEKINAPLSTKNE